MARGADYVLALKENHPTLHRHVADYFLRQTEAGERSGVVRHHRQVDTGHGRIETRDTYVAPVPAGWITAQAWAALASVVLVIRQSVDRASGHASDEVRYFLSSLPATAKRLAAVARQHWQIENGLHWVLDVAFQEDRMRQRDRQAIENLALGNRLARSLLRQDQTVKAGVKCRRKTAGWNDNYLLQLLLNEA